MSKVSRLGGNDVGMRCAQEFLVVMSRYANAEHARSLRCFEPNWRVLDDL